jgi:hypothetical protein
MSLIIQGRTFFFCISNKSQSGDDCLNPQGHCKVFISLHRLSTTTKPLSLLLFWLALFYSFGRLVITPFSSHAYCFFIDAAIFLG